MISEFGLSISGLFSEPWFAGLKDGQKNCFYKNEKLEAVAICDYLKDEYAVWQKMKLSLLYRMKS